jgi:hypothetical protein
LERGTAVLTRTARVVGQIEDSIRRASRTPAPALGVPIPGGRQAAGIIQPRASSDLADRLLGLTVGASGR